MALVLVLNYIGVRIAIGAMLTFAALSFTPMLILAIAIMFQANNTLAVFNPSTTSIHTVFNGVMLGILLFVGSRRRRRSARRATTRPSRSHGR